MPRLNEVLTTEGYFEIDNLPHQKGAYDLDLDATAETIGIIKLNRNRGNAFLFRPQGFAQWTNQAGTPYASFAAALTDFRLAFFLGF